MINAATVTLIFSATVYFLWSPANLIGREGESTRNKRQGAKEQDRGRIGNKEIVNGNLPGS